MKKLLLPVLLLFVLAGCDKDKFQTKPTLTIKSYNSKVIGLDEDLEIRLGFTDKEGDVSEGTFVYYPQRLNKIPVATPLDTITSMVPKFPNNDKGDIYLKLPYIFLHQSDIENDTFVFRMVVIDRAGNKSDTAISDKIVILQ